MAEKSKVSGDSSGAANGREELYRNLFTEMSAGFALHEILCDESGNPVDYRFLDVNPAFEHMTGLKREQVAGKCVCEVLPGVEKEDWIATYGRVALTGVPCRFENFSALLNRWYEVFAYRPAEMQFAVLFTDVTERKRTEEGIKDIAKFPLENPFPTLRIQQNGKIIFANPASDILLHEWKTTSTGAVPERWIGSIKSALELQVSQIIEEQIGEKHFSFHIVPIKETDYVNVYGSNVTHLKQVQGELTKHKEHLEELVITRTKELSHAYEELRVKQESLEQAQRIARIGNWDWNIMTNALAWSDGIFHIFGLRPQEFDATYDAFLNAVHPEDRDFVVESVNDALTRNKPYNIDHRIMLPDGTVRIVHEQAEVTRDAGGKAVRMVGSVQDVTEQRDAVEAVSAERRRLYDVLEMLPVYVVLLAPDYHVPFENRFFRERFGESAGRRCFEFLFNRTEVCEDCESYIAMKTGKPHEWEWTSPDGGIFQVYDFPFIDSDGANLILEMGIEITARKHAEDALKKREKQLEMLSRKVITSQEEERASISRNLHDELGQRLSALSMDINFLEAQEIINRENIASLGEAIAAINVELHRIYQGLRPAALDRLGLEAAIQALIWEYKNRFELKIHANIDGPACKTDNERAIIIYRILQESLTNVARHSGAREVRINLERDNEHIILAITDDGTGFNPEETYNKGGMGLLGMKERAAIIDGEIEIDTAQGQGTRILMRIAGGNGGTQE